VEENQVYAIHQLRQHKYEHSDAGRKELRNVLPEYIRKAKTFSQDEESWKIIRGAFPRTQMLVRDLGLVLKETPKSRLKRLTIRMVAGLGSLAICDEEPRDPNADARYFPLLVKERNILRKAFAGGARLKAVLNPPRRFAQSLGPARVQERECRLATSD
jgi:hypothetical protein